VASVMSLGVLLVHGIGTQQADWAAQVIPRIEAAARARVRALVDPAEQDPIVVEAVTWADILSANQRRLYEHLERHQPVHRSKSWPARLWNWMWSRWRRVERRLLAEYVSDVIGYLDPETSRAIQARLSGALARLRPRLTGTAERAPLSIIAHSLGTVISSDYIWDQMKRRRASGGSGFHDSWSLANFFTLGSPLALFSLRFGGAEAFRQPIVMEAQAGRWVNMYDADDPIGMPLKGLNEEYGRAVWRDVAVEAGGYVLSHTRYFTDRQTLDIIASKLALDWAAASGALPPERAAELAAHYDAHLTLPS